MEEAWYAPNDPIAGLYKSEVGFMKRFLQGDLANAEAPIFARIEGRCKALRFPYGPITLCYGQAREAGAGSTHRSRPTGPRQATSSRKWRLAEPTSTASANG